MGEKRVFSVGDIVFNPDLDVDGEMEILGYGDYDSTTGYLNKEQALNLINFIKEAFNIS